jgi:hypothetical protein
MDQPVHPLKELFEQLGLPADAEAINRFIATHSPLPENITLSNAPFWTPAQAAFLREEFLEDADWIEIIDRLNVALRAKQA